jgi:hypothetical protein
MQGSDSLVSAQGMHNNIVLQGEFDAANLSGSSNTAVSTGDHNTIRLHGTHNAADAQGDRDTVIDDGTGNHALLNGNSDSARLSGIDGELIVNGSGASITLRGTDNTAIVKGDNATLLDAGSGNTVVLCGDNESVVVLGTNTHVISTGIGNVITVSGTGDEIEAWNAAVNLRNGVSTAVDGGNNIIAMGTSAALTLTGALDDVIHVSSSDKSDVLAFGDKFGHDQLWFAQSNGDLVISVIGKDSDVTIADWFDAPNSHVGTIKTSDGFFVSDAGVDQLVQAMSAFSPPVGTDPLPDAVAAALVGVLAANWQHS